MFGYAKTIKLVVLEFIMCMGLHVAYAFAQYGITVGMRGLIISVVLSMLSILVSMLIKKEKIVIVLILLMMVSATEMLGISVHTLAFSSFIYLAVTASLTIFMEKQYIVYSYAVSIISVVVNLIFFRDYIKANTGSIFIYLVYIFIFSISVINLYIIVHYSKIFMKGMEEKAREAERANESKMMFLANISHEIRTPMNAICGMTELASREDNSPIVEEYISGIQSSGKVLLSIVNDILDYSKLESGCFEIVPVSYSLTNLLDDMVSMMQIRLADKEVLLKYTIDEDVPPVLFGDEIRFRQILFNLISNAIKYTEKGYIAIHVSGKAEEENYRLFVSVTDSGVGIRKDDFDRIFVSFAQVDTRKHRNREGTGLGLAICKELTTLMGGSIKVESTYGVGSKFSFDILQKISTDTDFVLNAKNKDKKENKVTVENSKVLVVDDNAVNLKVAQGLLRTFGLTVDTCMSGQECLEILRKEQVYDIVFLDHMMPELDGIDTLRLIRQEDDEYMKKVPLIALTANVMSGVREMFIAEGFDDYVPKPIDMVWMNSILRKYVPADKQK